MIVQKITSTGPSDQIPQRFNSHPGIMIVQKSRTCVFTTGLNSVSIPIRELWSFKTGPKDRIPEPNISFNSHPGIMIVQKYNPETYRNKEGEVSIPIRELWSFKIGINPMEKEQTGKFQFPSGNYDRSNNWLNTWGGIFQSFNSHPGIMIVQNQRLSRHINQALLAGFARAAQKEALAPPSKTRLLPQSPSLSNRVPAMLFAHHRLSQPGNANTSPQLIPSGNHTPSKLHSTRPIPIVVL